MALKNWVRRLFAPTRPIVTRRPTSLGLEALDARINPTDLAYGLYDTGVDAAGAALAGGTVDSHYTLTTNPGTSGSGVKALGNPGAAPYFWVGNAANSTWVVPNGTNVVGTYTYQTTFTVPAGGAGPATITGQLAVDNNLTDILVNGVSTGTTRTNGQASLSSFTLRVNLVEGVNTFTAVTYDGGHPGGLQLRNLDVDTTGVAFAAPAETLDPSVTGTFSIPVTLAGGPVTLTSSVAAGGFNSATDVAFDVAGNMYVANRNGGTVTKITPGGTRSAFGSGYTNPVGLEFDAAGNLYVADNGVGKIWKVAPNGTTTAFVTSGVANPHGMAFDAAGNLYVANNVASGTITKVTPQGVKTTFASGLSYPAALAFDAAGNLYAANEGNGSGQAVEVITPAGAVSNYVTGLSGPTAIIFDPAGNLYVANNNTGVVNRVTPGRVVTAVASGFANPMRFAYDPSGNLFLAGGSANQVFELTRPTVTVPFTVGGTAVAGTDYTLTSTSPLSFAPGETTKTITGTLIAQPGSGNKTVTFTLGTPSGAVPLFTPSANTLTIANPQAGVTSTPTVTSPAGAATVSADSVTIAGAAPLGSLVQVYADANGNGSVDPGEAVVGSQQLGGAEANYAIVVPLAPNADNKFLVTATQPGDSESAPAVVGTLTNRTAVEFATSAETVPSAAGAFSVTVTLTGGPAPIVGTAFAQVSAAPLAFDAAGNLYVGDLFGNVVRKVTPAGAVSTFASGFNYPNGLAFDAAGNLYVSSSGTVKKVTPAGAVSDYVTGLPLNSGLAFDASGNLYVAASQSNEIYKVAPGGGAAAVFATGFNDPEGLAIDAAGTLYVADTGSGLLKTVSPAGAVSTYAGGFTSPTQLAFHNGDLYVTERGGADDVVRLTPGGAVDVLPTGLTNIYGVAVDATGHLYVAGINNFQVNRYAPATITVSFTAGGTAVEGTDYTLSTTGPLSFAEGETTKTITGTLISRPGAGDQTVTFTLGTPSNGVTAFSPTTNTLTITNPDLTAAPTVGSPSAPTTTSATSLTLTGTAPADSLVKVYDDANDNGVIDAGEAVVGSQQLAGGATAYSVTVPLPANATSHFLVTATVAPAVESDPVAVAPVTRDSTAPAGTTVTSPAAATSVNAATTTVAGTAEANSLVQVFRDLDGNGQADPGEPVVGSQQLAGGATAYSVTVPLVQDAPNRFVVTATDAAGNRSAPVAVPTVTEDSSNPANPTVTSPSGPVASNSATTTVTGTAEPNALVEVFRDVNGNGVIDAGEPAVGSQQLANGATGYAVTVPLVADAPNKFLVRATDAAGNASAPAAVPTVTQDSTPPTGTTVTSPTGPATVNAGSTTVQGTAEPNSLVQVWKDLNNNNQVDAGEPVLAAQQLAGGGTFYSITVPLAQDAANNYVVTATDAAGNRSAAADVPTQTEDSTPPAAPTVSNPAGATTTGATSTTVAGTAAANSLVTVFRDLNGNGQADPGEPAVGSQQLAGGATAYAVTVPLAANAPNAFVVVATDAAGNQSPGTATATVTQDSTPPAGTTVTSPTGPTAAAAGTTTVAGTAEAGSLVQVWKDANNNGVIDAGEPAVGSQQLAPGQTAYAVTVPLAPDAANDFLVTASDPSGNRSAPADVATVTQDSTPPAAATVTSPAGAATVDAASTTVEGTAEPNSLVKGYRDVNDNGVVDAGDVVLSAQQLTGGGTFYSVSVPLLSDAPNHFLVTATDAAGNASAAAAVPTVTEDSTAPAGTTVASPAGPVAVGAGTTTVAGTAEVGSLVQVYRDVNGNGIVDAGDTLAGGEQLGAGETDYAVVVPLLPNAVNRFLVTATDGVGNVGGPVAVPTVTADTVTPAGPALASPAGRTATRASSITLTGTAEAGALVRAYDDADGNGRLDAGEVVVGSQQLVAPATGYAITVPLAADGVNHFVVTATDAAGNESAATPVPNVVQGAPDAGVPHGVYALGADAGGGVARLLNPDGSVRLSVAPFPGTPGGVRVAAADVNGDGVADLVTATGPGAPNRVTVYDGGSGRVLTDFAPFEGTFAGGVYVEAADLNGDGKAEVIATPDVTGGPRVVVRDGADGRELASFLGIDDANFRGGVRVGAGDLNGDGTPDLLVAAGFGGGPRVAGFDGKELLAGHVTRLFSDFFVFDPGLRNGVNLTAADLNGDGFGDLVLGSGVGGAPRVLALSGKEFLATGTQAVLANFFAGDPAARNGVRVAAADLDLDERTDLVVGAGPNDGSRVEVYLGKDVSPAGAPAAFDEFDAFGNQGDPATAFKGGVNPG